MMLGPVGAFKQSYSSLLDFCFDQDGITGTGFTFIPVINKPKDKICEVMVFKTLDSRQ